jgi:hypothetical protein
MSEYTKQKDKKLYSQQSYDHKSRFISYYNQKSLILKYLKLMPKNASILEVGVGSKFTYNYLVQQCGIKNVKTFDFARDLKPDYVGDITKASKVIKSKFNLVCCFEVLEHIEYSDTKQALEELKKITKDVLILSIPQSNLYLGLAVSLPKIGLLSTLFSIQSRKKHVFDGEHYWELGKKNTSIKQFRVRINDYFQIIEEYVDPLDQYHRYFVCRPK